MNDRSLVWFPMSPTVGFIAAIGATETIHLPLFLSGSDLATFKQSGTVNFSPITLLYGILYGSSDSAPSVDVSLSSRYFAKALDLLASELKMPTVETLVLTAGANIREEFGSSVSARMLENGLRFVPESNEIRSDCIVDVWISAEERDEQDHLTVLRDIASMLKKIDFSFLDPFFRERLSYIATVVFSETEPSEMTDFIQTHFNDDDLDWTPKRKKQIADYRASRQFSWKALTIR